MCGITLKRTIYQKNPCYNNSKRVGCIFCPFAPIKQIFKTIRQRPKLFAALLNQLQKYLDNQKIKNKNFINAEDYFMWWIRRENIKTYNEKKKQIEIKF